MLCLLYTPIHIGKIINKLGDDCVRKLNYDDVKKCVESYGFELISTEYHGVHDKIKIKCSKGHESEMIFSNFKRRHELIYHAFFFWIFNNW